MQFPMYSNGSFNPSQGNGLPPPPPPPVQQGYMYPSSSQGVTQTGRGTSHSQLPHVSMLPPPPPLPPGTIPLSFPLRSLEPPGMSLPPPPPRSSLPLVAETDGDKSVNGIALDREGTVVEDAGSSKESSIHRGESLELLGKAEDGSPSCTDPDIEMEDDITLPENENYPSDQVHGEQSRPRLSAETNSIRGNTMNVQIEAPAHLHQDMDDGSRQASSSPYSGRAKIVQKCGVGDMYDPFLDSYEPASVKLDCVQEVVPANDLCNVPKASVSSNRPLSMEENNQGVDKQALSESDMTARVSVSSNKPPDVEDTTGNDTGGAVVCGVNDEFGENAEHGKECNSHDTLTPNSHNENPNADNSVHEGDDTRKRSRDSSRSMKLFQVVLTKFVKDLLKPSWRQGNMSKEAFKTIVKKAVEKVSNSMEGRHIPKSRAKIDRYIDTSQQKLTKLVMGYVDKYVKA